MPPPALAASALAGEAPRLSFVYLGAVDVVGHVLGGQVPGWP